ncbi:SLC13 family permease [Pseudonocardia parietis]|uniref:Arsenical pump membrane protein n=1 Tax=Pseudonocardia parietis TaxID=570936 RepID=A0ABS4W0G8_9PSEU|nr:SLC13 family permease [Pseudonocardia parietis]MBP2369174.1 arsenical pump membrane protein [Pseudonocardia parietis]
MSLLLGVALLAVVLVTATLRPPRLSEAVVAVPAAIVAVAAGLVTPAGAWAEIGELAPTVGFLAAILLLGHLADAEGVFRWLGSRLARASGGSPRRLLAWVFVAAAGTTAVLSLDATVVLLTPVVLATATRLRVPARPHSYACVHLSNSASGLLPVSNLTNLLAFSASGLSFLGFAGLMVGPWLAVIAVEYLVLRWFFARDLPGRAEPEAGAGAAEHRAGAPGCPSRPDHSGAAAGADPEGAATSGPAPVAALAVLAATLVGFGASSAVGIGPGWVAAAGAAVLAVRALLRRATGPVQLVAAASPGFCLFVFALGVVVEGVSGQGLAAWLGALLPDSPDLAGLLATAVLAAVLANLVNNLPATLVLLAALGPAPHAGLVLAVLLGVNVGPNLTYAGSLATLLWRRIAAGHGAAPRFGTFAALGALTVPLGLLAATLALWASLTLAG